MNYSIKLMLALMILFSAGMAHSADSAHMVTLCKVVAEDDKLYRVIYQAVELGDVTIHLYDTDAQLVHKEKVKMTAGFVKQFDLSGLPVGHYQLEVKAPGYLFSEEITLGDLAGFNFVFSAQNDREIAMVGSHQQGRAMTLYILDQNREVVYWENFEDTKEVHKLYNFKNLKSQKVTFVLYHADQLISERAFEF